MDHFGVDKLDMTNSDLQDLLRIHGRDIRDAHRIICKVWDVPRANNKVAYDHFNDWPNRTSTRKYGRFYSFTRSFLMGLVPDYAASAQLDTDTDKERRKMDSFSLDFHKSEELRNA